MNWYFLKNGQCVGPVPAAEIIRLVREGQLLRNDRVRHDEYGPWLRVAQVPTLRPVARPGSAAPRPRGLAAYVVAHWRGQLPLAQSFWLITVLPLLLLSAGFFAAIHGRLPALSSAFSARDLALLLASAAITLLPWQFIGAWRAAEQRLRHAEDPAASAACFGLAAVVAQLFGLFAWSVPAFMPEPPVAARVAVVATPAPGTPVAPKQMPATLAKPATAPAAPGAVELLATIEPFATLRTKVPGEYRAAQSLVERAQRAGAGDEAALAQAAGMIQPLAERYMPLAPDAALSAYVGVLLRELQALQAKDAALCAGFAYPRASEPVRLAEHVDGQLLRAERVALTEVIRAAVLQPQARADFADVQQDLVGVYRRVAARHGSAVYRLDKPYETGFDDSQLCQVTIDVYAEFQKLPPKARGKVLRFTLGS